DGLVRTRPVVFEHVVLTNAGDGDAGPADARQNSAQGRRGFVGERIEGTRGLLRNDQGVAGTERVDIEKGEDLLILIDFVARNRAPQDLAEDGLCHGIPRSAHARSHLLWLKLPEHGPPSTVYLAGRSMRGMLESLLSWFSPFRLM